LFVFWDGNLVLSYAHGQKKKRWFSRLPQERLAVLEKSRQGKSGVGAADAQRASRDASQVLSGRAKREIKCFFGTFGYKKFLVKQTERAKTKTHQ
jgi:hypothetical protein